MISALFILLVALFAWAEAKRDARLIREERLIDHAGRWMYRASIALSLLAIASGVLGHQLHDHRCTLTVLLLWVAAGALFSACFRYLLNRRRKLSWWYMGGTPFTKASYDRLWWRVRMWAMLRWKWTERRWRFIRSYGADAKCERQVARITYCAELLLTLAALVAVSKL